MHSCQTVCLCFQCLLLLNCTPARRTWVHGLRRAATGGEGGGDTSATAAASCRAVPPAQPMRPGQLCSRCVGAAAGGGAPRVGRRAAHRSSCASGTCVRWSCAAKDSCSNFRRCNTCAAAAALRHCCCVLLLCVCGKFPVNPAAMVNEFYFYHEVIPKEFLANSSQIHCKLLSCWGRTLQDWLPDESTAAAHVRRE